MTPTITYTHHNPKTAAWFVEVSGTAWLPNGTRWHRIVRCETGSVLSPFIPATRRQQVLATRKARQALRRLLQGGPIEPPSSGE